MKIDEISNLRLRDMNKMTDDELVETVKTIGRYVNRSYNNIKHSGFRESDTTRKLDASGGKISSVYGRNQVKSRDDLKKEIMRAQVYVQGPWSTLTKLRAQRHTVEQRLNPDHKKGMKFKDDAQYALFWEVYNKVEELLVAIPYNDNTQQEIKSMLKDGMSIDDILSFYEDMYIRHQKEREEYDTADAIQKKPNISGELNNV